MILSVWLIVGVASQRSVAVALPWPVGLVSAVQATVTLAGQVIVGGALSCTVIVCVQITPATLLVHVRVIVYSSAQPPAAVTSAYVIVPQPFVIVGMPRFGFDGSVESLHSIVTLAGGHTGTQQFIGSMRVNGSMSVLQLLTSTSSNVYIPASSPVAV